MRIAALVHFYAPFRMAGSEVVAHELLKAASDAGHEVMVWCTHKDAMNNWRGNEPDTVYDGINVRRVKNSLIGAQQVKRWKPDVVFSHHDHSMLSIRIAREIGARSVYATHNDMDINERPLRLRPDLVLFNSDWVKESLSRFKEPKASLTFHPPLTANRHTVAKTGDAVTLVNLNEHKGAKIFYELARRMPDTRFLGVVGGHGQQVIKRKQPNVTIMEHGPDMRLVWEQTRVLLMPSIYESYGLVAVEAGINGIPTIANPTPGLIENLGKGGLFVDRENITGWVDEIARLNDGDIYEGESEYAKGRAKLALDATRQSLNQWCEWLQPSKAVLK